MEATTTIGVAQKVRRAVLLHDGAGLPDGRLLDFFIDHRDNDAFATLLRRHGPMVWGVCHRLLDREDAEDAFQATFLVLVHKAASVVPREQVGNWLYGVARRTALQARRTTARRNEREKQVAEMPEPAVPEDAVWPELQPLLDREVGRLPDQYRTVIVLCDLEGNTRKEAARQLGVPEGSVAGWLARGRALLAKRLAQQGVALSIGALASALGRAAARPPSWVTSSTIKAARVYAAGPASTEGMIPVKVAALTEGVLKAMMVSKTKLVTAVLLAVVCLGSTVAFLSPAVSQPHSVEKNDGNTKSAPGRPPAAEKNDGSIPVAAGERRPETDETRLQGRWEVVSVAGAEKVFNKADAPNELKDLDDLLIKGDQLLPTKSNEFNSCWGGTFTLDASRNPKQITIRHEGPDGKLTFRGIYSIDGDVFKMCFNDNAMDVCRPEEFVTRKGSQVNIVTFKKVPPKK